MQRFIQSGIVEKLFGLGVFTGDGILYLLLPFQHVRPLVGMHVLVAGNGAAISEKRYEHASINSFAYEKSRTHP